MISTCPICLSLCIIPVQMTCFPCFSKKETHCHSFVRFCYSCALQYLQQEKPDSERTGILRCLFCDERVRLEQLDGAPFSIDKDEIGRDTREAIACRHCEWVAPTHTALLAHSWDECRGFPGSRCGDCGAVYCGEHECDACPLCHKNIENDGWLFHIREDHGVVYCILCEKFSELSLAEHRDHECLYRPVKCKYCSVYVQAIHFTDHLMGHLENSKKRRRFLEEILETERIISQRMLEEAQEFFRLTYPDTS